MKNSEDNFLTPPNATLKVVGQFIASLQKAGKSANTVKAYQFDVVEFTKWMQLRTNREFDLAAVDSQDLLDYRRQMLGKKLKAASINRRLNAIRHLYKWAVLTRQILLNPFDAIHQPFIKEQKQTAPKWLDRNQQLALLRAVRKDKDPRDYAIIQTFLGTGLRISELAALEVSDLEISERSGWLKVRVGKGNKTREIPLNLKTRQALSAYLEAREGSDVSCERLFLGQRGPINQSGINYLVEKYAWQANLVQCTPHTLRHSYAKNLIDAGTPLDQVATLLGHESLATTQIYVRPSKADLEQAVRRAAGEEI